VRILGFCEGIRVDTGGVGLVGVPGIHRALADRGHRDALAIAGEPMVSARPVLKDRLEEVFDAREESASGVVSFPAFGKWCFSPHLYAAAAHVASRADFITMHSLFSYPVLTGYLLARRYARPYGLWPHGVLAPVQRKISSSKKALYSALLARRILESASVLFFSASGERDEARELGLNVPSVVIPHGIDVSQFADLPARGAFRKRYLSGHTGPVVLYLGRLNAKKGLDLLIEAMARVVREIPDVKLVIAGGGHPPAFANEVRRWLGAGGIAGAAILTGVLDEPDKLTAFADCDVFVLPSIAENFGFSMFEAMACRRAIVCSETVNYAGEVRSWEAGLVVPRTSEAFAGAITTLLLDPMRRDTLAANGLALARTYSWDSCGERLEAAVRCVLTHQPFPAILEPALSFDS
jgi:glycosyltransferase involved in cell wall biosynthesis